MKFLLDRCAGRRLTIWLREKGHDVVDSVERGEDPGDEVILAWAAEEGRVLVTMDKDFGELVFKDQRSHSGLLRLPDVRVEERIRLVQRVLDDHEDALLSGGVVTVRGGRVRVSKQD